MDPANERGTGAHDRSAAFTLVCPERMYFLRADSAASMQEWMMALHNTRVCSL
jgi:hypothetical protein